MKKKAKATGGHVTGGETQWSWAEADGSGEIWTGTDTLVLVGDVLQAGRLTRAEMSSDLVTPAVRIVPSTYAVIGEVLDLSGARDRYDGMLIAALRVLGVSGAKGMCEYGMPSEYRGWLAWARESALVYLRRSEGDEEAWQTRHLAEEIVMGTCAVALSMRHGYATTPFTTAVALKGVLDAIPEVELRHVTFQEFVDAVEGTLRSEAPYVPAARPFADLPGEVEWIAKHVTLRLGHYGADEVVLYFVADGIHVHPVAHPMTLRDAQDVARGIAAMFDAPEQSAEEE